MNRRVTLSALGFAASVLVACSGASPQLVDVAPTDGAGPSSAGSSSGTGDDDASPPGGNGSSSGGGNGSSGSGSGGGSSGGTPAPSQCPSNGTQQSGGSGQSQSNASPFDTVACGTLASGQSYWWTFVLPPSTSSFGIAFTGGLQIELTVDGTTVNVTPGTNLPFHTKTPYYLQITPTGSASTSYVLVVSEK